MPGRLFKSCTADGVIAYQDTEDAATFHYFPARIDAIEGETIMDFDVKYYGINAKPYFVDTGNRKYLSCVGATVSGQGVADISAKQRKAIEAECIKKFKVKEVNLVPLTLQDVTVQPIIAKNLIEMGTGNTVTFPERFQVGTQFGFNIASGNSLFAELVGNQGSDDRSKSPDIGVNFYGTAELRADPWEARIEADLSRVWSYTRKKFSAEGRIGWFNIGGADLDSITQELQANNIVKITYIEGSGGKEFGRALLESTKTLFEAINAQITAGEGMFKFEPNPAPQEPPPKKDSLGGDLLPWRVSINASYVSNSFKQSIKFDNTIRFEGNTLVAFNGNMALALICNSNSRKHFYDLQLKQEGCIDTAKSNGLQGRITKEVKAKDAKVLEYLKKVEDGVWTLDTFAQMLTLLDGITLTEAPKVTVAADGAVSVEAMSETEALAALALEEAAVLAQLNAAQAERRGGRFHKVFPPDGRTQVKNTTVSPWNGIGQLEMTFKNGLVYTGTGTLIGSKYVLTAAHNVFDSNDGGEVKSVTFTPAQNGATKPYKTIRAKAWHYRKAFETNESDYSLDYAVIELEADAPSGLTHYEPKVASDTDLMKMAVQIAGYPGDKTAGTMWCAKGKLASVSAKLLSYKLSTYQGESGSAVATEDKVSGQWQIVGIHDGATTDVNQACRITQAVLDDINTWRGVKQRSEQAAKAVVTEDAHECVPA